MRIRIAAWTVVLAVAMATAGWATEGGGGAYPNGAEGFMAGAVPPPGHYVVNYLTYYTADKLAGPDGDALMPNFDLDVVADVVRYIYVSKTQLLGGFWGAQVFVPFVSMDVSMPNMASEPVTRMSDSKSGVGDIIVDPVLMSWHTKNVHAAAGVDVYIPVGNYEATDLANISRGYVTIEPVFGVTYMSDGGLDVSAKLMYDFNMENSDTDYTSGQEFHADYTVAQKLGAWSLGVGGYYYQQTTEDDSDIAEAQVMGKGMAFAVGPQVKFDYKKMSFIAKYQDEIDVENRPEGQKFWLNVVIAF